VSRRQRRASGKREHVTFSEVVNAVLGDMDDTTVMVGPILTNEDIGLDKRYIVVATSQKGSGFGCDRLIFGSQEDAELFRRQFMLELCSRPPLVVHYFDDELDIAMRCNAAWPCEKPRAPSAAWNVSGKARPVFIERCGYWYARRGGGSVRLSWSGAVR
jgi:hypothetical protein